MLCSGVSPDVACEVYPITIMLVNQLTCMRGEFCVRQISAEMKSGIQPVPVLPRGPGLRATRFGAARKITLEMP